MDPKLRRALEHFDAKAFVAKHRGYKETPSPRTFEWLLPCPRCGSSRLRWNNKKQLFICWGCKLTGDTLRLVQIMERCDEMGALTYVLDGYVGGDAKRELEDLVPPAPQVSAQSYQKVLKQLPWPDGVETLTAPCAPHQEAWRYLEGRGIGADLVLQYKLAYGRVGRLARYVVFPCYMDGKLVYYQGRASWDPPVHLNKEARKEWIKITGYRKTLNPPNVEGCATASDVLYNYDLAKFYTHIVICEGPIDVIKVGLHAVGLFGKVYSPGKIERLMRTRARQFTIYLDRGEEEQARAEELASELSGFGQVSIAVPPVGEDAGSQTLEQNAAVIASAREWRPRVITTTL